MPGHWRREVGDSNSLSVDGITTIPTLSGSRHSDKAMCVSDCLMEYSWHLHFISMFELFL